VYVTHDQEEALSLSDRVAVMRDGRVQQVAPPKALYERPANRFVADFVGTKQLHPWRGQGARRRACAGAGRRSVPCTPARRRSCARRRLRARRAPGRTSRWTAPARTSSRGAWRLAAYLGNTLRYDVETATGLVLKVDVGDPLASRGAAGGTVRARGVSRLGHASCCAMSDARDG